MASFPEAPILEIYHGHKREQSQDSGAYIDWNSEDSASPTGNMDAKGEFVTVVAVESNGIAEESTQNGSSFVTVLEINDEDGKAETDEDIIEEVLIYRLPGERLGFGLKFEGGTNTAENVKRLFIQSSAPDSPASRAECSWGSLVEGDEIIKIDGHEVREMTRLDCVRCLKESSVVIKLYVRHPNRVEKSDKSSKSPLVISAEIKKKVPPPPPIPPRKIPRKAPQKDEVPLVGPPEAFCDVPVPKMRSLTTAPDDNAKNQSKSSVFVPAREVADASKRMPKRNGFDLKHIPPVPEVYLDILSQEDMKNNWESESDDTGSTISTVMGFSATNSSFDLRSNTDSTTPSTPTSIPSTPVLDVAKMMHQNSEREFLFTKMINDKSQDLISYDEKTICNDDNAPLQPPLSFQDAPLSYGNEEIKVSLTEAIDDPSKCLPEEGQEEGELTKSKTGYVKKTSLIPRLAKSIGLITSPPKPSPRREADKSRTKKKPPPPPPPPPPPRQPETEAKTLKSSIPYLKKKKTKNEKKLKSLSKPEAIENDMEESECPPEQDNPTLTWAVPELKNLRQQIETCVDEDENAEANLGTHQLLPCSSDMGLAMDTTRDPYFLQWGSSKHLETIGEDEEDGCSEDMSGGQREKQKEEVANDGKNLESPENREKSAESDTEEGQEQNEKPAHEDGSVIREEERKNVDGSHEGLTEKESDEAVTETDPLLNGGMKENMMPIVSATVGLVPPPTFSRLPPDGHEFPQNYQEGVPMPNKATMLFDEELKSDLPPLPTSEPPVSQRYSINLEVLPNKSFPNEHSEDIHPRASRPSFWRQDERSEKSVRDKIAMFSSVSDSPVSPANNFCAGKLSKYKSSDDVFFDDDSDCARTMPNGKHFSRSIVSIDKIGGAGNQVRNYKKCGYSEPSRSLDYANRTQSSMDLTSSSSSAYSSSCSPDSSLSSTTSSYLGYSSTLPRKSSRSEGVKNDKNDVGQKTAGVTRATSFSLHGRSQSLLDINPSPFKSRFKPDSEDDQKQSSLSLLIEQRRKNLSKLRGLVIPEKFPEIPPSQPIFDLPEIKSRDLLLTSKFPSVYKEERSSSHVKWDSQASSPLNLPSPPWKAQSKSPNVPKYSPAFKRKTISVYSTNCSPVKTDPDRSKPPAKPPRSIQSQVAFDSFGKNGDSPKSPLENAPRYPGTDLYGRKGKYIGRSEEDSDNDSAVSSSRSSISHGFSPPSSPLLDGQHQNSDELRGQLFASPLLEKSPVLRTHSSETNTSGASNTSTLTSGSQASCSSNGGSSSDCNSKRILKAQSVEAINRKNVLASAKYSRGFDAKSGSPLIQRKLIPSEKGEGSNATAQTYGKTDPVNYKLATDIKSADIKIAFVNDVDDVCGVVDKKKLTKTESSPCSTSAVTQTARRTSVPFVGTSWNEEEWIQSKNGHALLTGKPSSESLRSRASSVDTIIENVLINENEFLSPRLKPAKNAAETDIVIKRNCEIGDSKLADLYNKTQKDKGKEVVTSRSQRSVSVNDIRKAFEKVDLSLPANGRGNKMGNLQFGVNGNHVRVSSLDSTNSEDSCAFGPGQYGSSSNLHREQFGSITSLASSTSLISPQELQLLIDEANQTLEESGGCSGGSSAINHDVLVVILHRDTAGGSVGITLAGGADYESKEITVHKVLTGSPAERDGRIQKGDRILSINGKSMRGITHRESLAILKSPRPEVVLVVSRPKIEPNCDPVINDDNVVTTSVRSNLLSSRPPRILEGTTLNDSGESSNEEIARGPPVTFMLVKDGAGLGFSLEGGKDSPVGDKPLIIKKIFTGGAAEKCGHLKAGDEILNVNGIDVTLMSRIEAWKLMKRIPDGSVSITVRRQVENRAGSEDR